MTVAIIDQNNYWWLQIIGTIKFSDMVLYAFIEPTK